MDRYGARATDYDRHYSGAVETTENLVLFEQLRPYLNGRDVLDLGAGTGLVADYSSPRTYTAVDISPLMLNVLMDKHPEAEAWVADLDSTKVNLPEGQYDTAIALFSAYWFNIPSVLSALRGVLRPGGHVILHGVTPRRLKRPQSDLGAVDPVVWTDRVSAFTPTRVRSLLWSAGYTDVRAHGYNAVPDTITRHAGPLAQPLMTASQIIPARWHWHFAAVARI